MFQTALVSWSVTRDASLDLLTVGNLTFSGDERHSVIRQNPNNWVLAIKNVQEGDEGNYTCTVHTFPEQSIIVRLRVDGG